MFLMKIMAKNWPMTNLKSILSLISPRAREESQIVSIAVFQAILATDWHLFLVQQAFFPLPEPCLVSKNGNEAVSLISHQIMPIN